MSKRILIADDAMFMRTLIKNVLIKGGYEICGEAENGAQAVELYKKLKPDIATLDITMPEIDGITALKQIREYDPNAKCIMCTAMGQQAMVMECVKAGAKDFIIKPFQHETVLEAVNKIA